MSDTQRGNKGPGYEYWGRRPGDGYYANKFTKKRTAKIERQQAKQEIEERARDSEGSCQCYLCHNPKDHEPGDECCWEE